MKNHQKQDEDGWQKFLQLCSKVENPKRFREFFDLFLTIEEREPLADRYFIIKALLDEKETQREISENLKVSISKITRVSNAIKIISGSLQEFLKSNMK